MALAFTFIIQNEFLWCLKKKKNSNIKWPICVNPSPSFSQIREIHETLSENGGIGCCGDSKGLQQYYSMFYQHIYNPHVNDESKYKLLDHCLNNTFITEDVKDYFLYLFCKFQKIYFGFSRLALVYRLRKAKKEICYDMCLNELDQKSKNVLTILIDEHQYLYLLSDIVNIFKSALTNMNFMICTPIAIKNPYTNKEFSFSILYNFYFFLKSRLISVPFLIEEFYRSNFNLHTFTMLHDNYLQDLALTKYVENTPFIYLNDGMCSMLNDYNFVNQDVSIHPLFPEKELFNIMKKPYLLLYYKSKYSRTHEINMYYGRILKIILNEFFIHNPRFGTINFTLPTGEHNFNMKHISTKEIYRRLSENNKSLLESLGTVNNEYIYPSLGSYRNRRAPSYTSFNSNMNLVDTSSSDDDTVNVDDENSNSSGVRV